MDQGHLTYLMLGLGVFCFWIAVGAISVRRNRLTRRGWKGHGGAQQELSLKTPKGLPAR